MDKERIESVPSSSLRSSQHSSSPALWQNLSYHRRRPWRRRRRSRSHLSPISRESFGATSQTLTARAGTCSGKWEGDSIDENWVIGSSGAHLKYLEKKIRQKYGIDSKDEAFTAVENG